MQIDIDTAKKMRDAFGSCTHVYECCDPDELVEFAYEHDTMQSWLDLELSVEDIRAERMGRSIYREWREDMRPGVLQRLKTAFNYTHKED